MAKLMEMNGAEICAALVSISAVVRNLLDDQQIKQTFRECTKKAMANRLEGILTIYADMVPLLFGKQHLNDTLTILAVVEGTTVKEMLKMNGADLMADALAAWKEQLAPFFLRLGLSV